MYKFKSIWRRHVFLHYGLTYPYLCLVSFHLSSMESSYQSKELFNLQRVQHHQYKVLNILLCIAGCLYPASLFKGLKFDPIALYPYIVTKAAHYARREDII